VTAVRVSSLGRTTCAADVLILPSGNYANALGAEPVRRLKDWVTAGGTLITLGEASRWAARENVGLLETRTELRDGRAETGPSEKDEKKPDASPRPFDFERASRLTRTPGAARRHVRAVPTEHWLSAGPTAIQASWRAGGFMP
jgi:hypothetical protein